MKPYFLVGLILVSGSTPLRAEPIPARVILKDSRDYENGQQPRPALIPIRLLETPYDQWSAENRNRASRGDFEKFHDILEEIRFQGGSGNCTPGKGFPETPTEPKPGGRRLSLLKVAGTSKNILLGEVVATEPAWDPVTLQISTLVHLKIKSVVRGVDAIDVGDNVTYRRLWGTATVRGITLCSYVTGNSPLIPRSGREAPERLRPTFLILGRMIPGNGLYIDTHDFEEFQVVDGLVHYPPGIPFYHDNKAENLEALLLRFQGSSQ